MAETLIWLGWGAILGGLIYAAGYRRGRRDAFAYAVSLIQMATEDEGDKMLTAQREAARRGLQ